MTQFNAPTYNIERTTGECAFSGRKLQPGEAYIATLIELDLDDPAVKQAGGDASASGFKRQDVAMDQWEQGKRPERLFCFWRAVIPQPTEKKKLFVDDAVLYNLLLRLEDAQQPQRQAFRFVLALILMRKKLLRYDRTEKRTIAEGQTQEWWHVTPKLDLSKGPLGKWDDSSRLAVFNPQMDDDQIQQVTEQLGEILEAEL